MGGKFPCQACYYKGLRILLCEKKWLRPVSNYRCDADDWTGGRPQFDDKAVAVVLVEEELKTFYKRFLYDPFPAESSLIDGLADHLNAEVASINRIKTFDDSKKHF